MATISGENTKNRVRVANNQARYYSELAEEYKKSDYRPVQGSSHNFSGAGQNKLINLLTEFIKNH